MADGATSSAGVGCGPHAAPVLRSPYLLCAVAGWSLAQCACLSALHGDDETNALQSSQPHCMRAGVWGWSEPDTACHASHLLPGHCGHISKGSRGWLGHRRYPIADGAPEQGVLQRGARCAGQHGRLHLALLVESPRASEEVAPKVQRKLTVKRPPQTLLRMASEEASSSTGSISDVVRSFSVHSPGPSWLCSCS